MRDVKKYFAYFILIFLVVAYLIIGFFSMCYTDLIFVIGERYNSINVYLLGKNQDLFLSSIFSWLWAASIWTLAIIFSISLFAAQQSYSTYSQTAINIFRNDKTGRSIYFLISLLIFFFYILSFFDKIEFFQNNLLILVFWWCLWVLLLIGLVFIHYRRSILIISPWYVIDYFAGNISSLLDTTKISTPLWNIEEWDIPEWLTEEDVNKFIHLSQNTPNLNYYVKEIGNVVKKYQSRKEYSVVSYWIKRILLSVLEYIDFKWSLFFHNDSLITSISWVNLGQDNFLWSLDGVFEELLEIANIAWSSNDITTVTSVIKAYEVIAIKCLSIEYSWWQYRRENNLFSLAVIYIKNIGKDLWKKNTDIALQVAKAITRITPYVFEKDKDSCQMNMLSLLSVADVIFDLWLHSKDNIFLVPESLNIELNILEYAVYSGDETMLTSILSGLGSSYSGIKYHCKISMEVEKYMDVGFGKEHLTIIGQFFPQIYRQVIDRKEQLENFEDIIDILNEQLPMFYRDLWEYAWKEESKQLVFISHAVRDIIVIISELDNEEDTIQWYFSNYWWMYHKHIKITRNTWTLIKRDIIELGILFKEKGNIKLQEQVIDTLCYLATNFNKKRQDDFGFSFPRILLNALSYSIYVDKWDYFLEKFIDIVENEENVIHEEQWKIFIREYYQIKDSRIGMIESPSDTIKRSISQESLDSFFKDIATKMVELGIYPEM